VTALALVLVGALALILMGAFALLVLAAPVLLGGAAVPLLVLAPLTATLLVLGIHPVLLLATWRLRHRSYSLKQFRVQGAASGRALFVM